MQVLWTFIFGPPIASAPSTSLPSYSTRSSVALVPSRPSGSAALKSATSSIRVLETRSPARSTSMPAGPAARTTCVPSSVPRARSGPSGSRGSSPSFSARVQAAGAAIRAAVSNRSAGRRRRRPRSPPSAAAIGGAQPDGAEAEHDRAACRRGRAPSRCARSSSPRSCCSRWSRASRRPGRARRTPPAPRRRSPRRRHVLPPTQIAVFFRSSGPRVKNAPCTRARASSGVTLPRESSTSTPASWATIASNGLGCASVSSWSRTFFMFLLGRPSSDGCWTGGAPHARAARLVEGQVAPVQRGLLA